MVRIASNSMRLPDGRRLAWHEWGAPEGQVVLFCPGAGMAGAIPFGEVEAGRLGMRIVSVDRAGLGRSDGDPGKSFASWTSDVTQLLSHLGAPTARAIGFSQGGPFALALAAAGLVRSVAVVSGQDELSEPAILAQLPAPVAEMVERAGASPEAFEAEVAAVATADWLWQMIETMSGDADRAFYASETFAPMYRAALAAGFRQGAAGYARDTRLAMARWPFRVETIACPVRLWFGLADASPVHSPDFGRTLACRIPEAELVQVPSEGSAVLWSRAAEILETV